MTEKAPLPEIGGLPPLGRADEPEELTRSLRHELLIARDTIIGLTAELQTMRAQGNEIAATPVGVAYARVDGLENRLEAALRELSVESILRRKVHAELAAAAIDLIALRAELADAHSAREAQRDELATVQAALARTAADLAATRASATWRVGSLIVRPLAIIRGRR